jgi:hypothetical protein
MVCVIHHTFVAVSYIFIRHRNECFDTFESGTAAGCPQVEEIFFTRPKVRDDISHNPKRSSFGGISITVLGRLAAEKQPCIREWKKNLSQVRKRVYVS